MSVFTAVVVFLLTWWVMFFCFLPLNIETVNRSEKGSMPGAPVNPGIKRKLMLTTIAAIIVWGAIMAMIRSDLISFHDMAQKMPL